MKNYENVLLKALEEKHYFTNEDLRMNKRNSIINNAQIIKYMF